MNVGKWLLTLTLGALGTAQAQTTLPQTAPTTVALSALVQGAQAPAIYPSMPTYTLGGGLVLGVQGIDTADAGKVGAVLLLGNKAQLLPSEMNTLIQLVGTLSVQCFNISPERLVSISDWLIKRNAAQLPNLQTAHFGPLDITYRPWQYTDTARLASVVLSRRGTPGEEPWASSCSLR